jgi:hypothetical protein
MRVKASNSDYQQVLILKNLNDNVMKSIEEEPRSTPRRTID